MIGALLGFVKNMLFLGYNLVNAFVFMIAYNYLITPLNVWLGLQWDVQIMWTSITFLQTYALFIVIHFVGGFVKRLSPFYVKLSSESESNGEKE